MYKRFIKKIGRPRILLGRSEQIWILRSFVRQERKNAKLQKDCKIVFANFWQRYWSQRADFLHSTLSHSYLYFCFYKFFCIMHRSDNMKVVPRKRRRRRRPTTTTTTRTHTYHYMVCALPQTKRGKFPLLPIPEAQ